MFEYILDSGVLSVIVRLVLALICGGILGFERGRKKRPAGFRTYMLVCLGAALAIMTNEFIFTKYGGDPSRMAAQVISGIGFLGAGTIIVTAHNRVRGLTTAAGLWAAACIGLAIGIGYYDAAIIGCILIFITMSLLHKFDDRVTATTRLVYVYAEFFNVSNISVFITYLRDLDIHVADMEMIRSNNKDDMEIAALMTLKFDKKKEHHEISELLANAEGVSFIEET